MPRYSECFFDSASCQVVHILILLVFLAHSSNLRVHNVFESIGVAEIYWWQSCYQVNSLSSWIIRLVHQNKRYKRDVLCNIFYSILQLSDKFFVVLALPIASLYCFIFSLNIMNEVMADRLSHINSNCRFALWAASLWMHFHLLLWHIGACV